MTDELTAERRERVAALRAEGMSIRAIAQLLGVSKTTVERDLADVSRDTSPSIDELLLAGHQVSQTITPKDCGEITQAETTIDEAEHFARFGCRREPPPRTLADIPPGQVRIRHVRVRG